MSMICPLRVRSEVATVDVNRKLFLGAIPESLAAELLDAYNGIVSNFRQRRWDISELNGGKFCEIAYSILKGAMDSNFPTRAYKPGNFVDACRAIEQGQTGSLQRSLRIQVPRMLVALYEIRNNRGVGHVGGDVDPSHMDAACVIRMSKWVLAELVRVFHATDTTTAQQLVEDLTAKSSEVVWEVGARRRVLAPNMTYKNKTLLLLHHAGGGVPERELSEWVEAKSAATYRRDVLRPAHAACLLDYNSATGEVRITPPGISYVEEELLGT